MDQGRVELMHIAHCLVGTELNQLTPLIDIIRLPVSCFNPPIVRNLLCCHVSKYVA